MLLCASASDVPTPLLRLGQAEMCKGGGLGGGSGAGLVREYVGPRLMILLGTHFLSPLKQDARWLLSPFRLQFAEDKYIVYLLDNFHSRAPRRGIYISKCVRDDTRRAGFAPNDYLYRFLHYVVFHATSTRKRQS